MTNDKLAATGYEPIGAPVCTHGYSTRETQPDGVRIHIGTGGVCMSQRKEPDWHEQPAKVAITEEPAVGVQQTWLPQPRPGQAIDDLGIGEWIGQALGAASSCWSNLPEAGVFDSTRCKGIADGLEMHVNGLVRALIEEAERRRKLSDDYLVRENTMLRTKLADQAAQHEANLEAAKEEGRQEGARGAGAHLGLATTRQMLEELAVRFEVTTPYPMRAEKLRLMLAQLPRTDLDYRTVDL